ncbi:DUF397 domain-containing protein [Streptomyces sp. K1PN6]|uniref:DUF397 domain-containing protein n=2 Tax=Streptomyces acidicola TaxID=2596892 RepID=A0A5N8WRZ7_9ACTN|nr:DUF397 domain-containing protein [Streptomyces acidicola]
MVTSTLRPCRTYRTGIPVSIRDPGRGGASPRPGGTGRAAGAGSARGTFPRTHCEGTRTTTAVTEFEFRTSSTCQYNNNDPRCVEVATNVPDKVAVRSTVTGRTLEFTTDEWTDFLSGAKLGEFDVTA